ncbi:MAG: hypothetical protein QOJ80_227 [Mycobacterium sp.]|jgi:hypothetical protein|nr:hypothetical protein [Mycobacterium sp.]
MGVSRGDAGWVLRQGGSYTSSQRRERHETMRARPAEWKNSDVHLPRSDQRRLDPARRSR